MVAENITQTGPVCIEEEAFSWARSVQYCVHRQSEELSIPRRVRCERDRGYIDLCDKFHDRYLNISLTSENYDIILFATR